MDIEVEMLVEVLLDVGGVVLQFFEGVIDLLFVFWGKILGIVCFDYVVDGVMEEVYSYYINCFMILLNFVILFDVDVCQLIDWFWVVYVDVYDWVVEFNVFGMGIYVVGDVMMIKFYVLGFVYI